MVRKALPQSGDAAPTAEVLEVLPRFKEGGAFVKFSHAPGSTNESVAAAVQKYLREKNVKPWFSPLTSVNANLVLGKPWVEDLYRLPSPRLKVEFLPTNPGAEVAELSQEQLYSFFRPYGKLADIVPQPADSKILPKFAYVDFARMRKAVSAKVRLTNAETRYGCADLYRTVCTVTLSLKVREEAKPAPFSGSPTKRGKRQTGSETGSSTIPGSLYRFLQLLLLVSPWQFSTLSVHSPSRSTSQGLCTSRITKSTNGFRNKPMSC